MKTGGAGRASQVNQRSGELVGVEKGPGPDGAFRVIADEAPVLIWASGLGGGCTFFNRPWLEFTGRTLAQELGEGWTGGVHPQDLDVCMATYREAFRARRPFAMEYRLRRADGEYRWVLDHGRPRFGPGGEFEGFVGTCTDVTDHRLLEAELRAREAELRVMNDSLPVGMALIDDQGRVMQINPAAEQITGLSISEAAGDGWVMGVHPEDRAAVVEKWGRTWRAGAHFESEHRFVRRDGTVVWTRVRAAPVRVEDRLLGYVCVVEDITAAKEAREAIRLGMERQLQLLARERTLRRELDHRVRNNLASLLGLIALYEGSGRDAGSVAEALRGKIEVMREVHELFGNAAAPGVDLGVLARRLAGLLAPGRGRVVIDGPAVGLDQLQSSAMGMILHELFTNSRKHGALAHPAGRVEIRWRTGPGGFDFEWHEGSTAGPGAGKGVGLTLVEGFARGDLGGGAVFSFEPSGFRCVIRAGPGRRSGATEIPR